MSVQHSDIESAESSCSCTSTSLPSPAGEVIVLRVAGEIDLHSLPVLRAALADVLDRRSGHVIVDLVGLTFCSVGGLALLAAAAATAAAQGTEYAIGAAPLSANRVWAIAWTDAELPIRFPTADDGVLAALAHQAGRADDHAHRMPQHPSRTVLPIDPAACSPHHPSEENPFGIAASTAGRVS